MLLYYCCYFSVQYLSRRILKDLFQDIKRQLSFKLQLKPQIAHSIAALIYFQYELNYNKGAGKNKLCAFILFNNRKQNKF
jgi:hypothetical protein